jgi:2,5-furandicarboxylate decarboxylase 1
MPADLRSHLRLLEERGRLARIKREVDPKFELTAVLKHVVSRGQAALFERVKGSNLPLVSNIIGTREMLALAFGTTPARVVEKWSSCSNNPIEPVLASEGPVKEVVKIGDAASIDDLPLPTHCGKDAGPYITAGLVIARDPETELRNVSINRMMYRSARETGLRMMPPQHLGLIQEKAERLGKPLEVAIAIGNHPFEMVVAATSFALGQDEFTLSGGLRGEPLQLVKCETVDLEVPAFAEIVLEGEVVPDVREPEGPFGDFMQYYVPVMNNHVFRLRAISHRHNPIYQTIQASSTEDVHLLALSRESQVYEAVKRTGAKIRAISLSPTILNCVIAIDKQFEGEPKNVAAAAFGVYRWLKYCIVVDHDVDVFDLNDVWWAMATRSRPDKGTLLMADAMGFPRDPFNIHRSKLAIDATAPLGQWQEFERKIVPGTNEIRLEDYL